MELNNAVVPLRKRTHWEAMDLGLVLGRIWYSYLSLLALVSLLPLFLIIFTCYLYMPSTPICFLWLGFWVFSPLVESVLVIWISRAFFGTKLVFSNVFSLLWKQFSFSYLFFLVRYRFSSYRAIAYSILNLEGSSGKESKERLSIFIKRQQSGFFLYCSILLLYFIFTLSTTMLVFFLLPEKIVTISWIDFLFYKEGLIPFLLYLIFVVLLTPFAVSCGFMLYISSRIELEGWDIEIGFRNLEIRLKGSCQ